MRRARFRQLAAISAGVWLLLSAFFSAWGGPFGGGNGNGTPGKCNDADPNDPDCKILDDDDDDDIDLDDDDGGGGAGGDRVYVAQQEFDPVARGQGIADQGQLRADGAGVPDLPEGLTDVDSPRLVPDEVEIPIGECREFDFLVRSRVDGQWYSVLKREISWTIGDPECVVLQDGSKNRLCVPISAPEGCTHRPVDVVATVQISGVEPLPAGARVRIVGEDRPGGGASRRPGVAPRRRRQGTESIPTPRGTEGRATGAPVRRGTPDRQVRRGRTGGRLARRTAVRYGRRSPWSLARKGRKVRKVGVARARGEGLEVGRGKPRDASVLPGVRQGG